MRVLFLLPLAMLSGCFFLPDTGTYEPVAAGEPLKVPDDLDKPPSTQLFFVTPGDQLPEGAQDAVALPVPGTRVSGEVLFPNRRAELSYAGFVDAVENSALELVDRAPEESGVIVEYDDPMVEETEPGFLSRVVLRREASEDYSGRYFIRLVDTPRGADIVVRDEQNRVALPAVEAGIRQQLEDAIGT